MQRVPSRRVVDRTARAMAGAGDTAWGEDFDDGDRASRRARQAAVTAYTSGIGTTRRDWRIALVVAIGLAVLAAALVAPPYAQDEAYHQFADQRAFLGIPNLFDVVSNIAFLVAGLGGLWFVVRGTHSDGTHAFEQPADRWCWGVVCVAVALTCCGSWYYHLVPDSARLAWDRLPMAVAFAGILAATIAERVSGRAGGLLLGPLVLLGAASVGYWRYTVVMGRESLNLYAAVQFGSLLLIVLLISLFPSRYTRGGDLWGAFGLYALAKVAEHYDYPILAATGGVVSGHTLKHLIAAAAMAWLVRMLVLRRAAAPSQSVIAAG